MVPHRLHLVDAVIHPPDDEVGKFGTDTQRGIPPPRAQTIGDALPGGQVHKTVRGAFGEVGGGWAGVRPGARRPAATTTMAMPRNPRTARGGTEPLAPAMPDDPSTKSRRATRRINVWWETRTQWNTRPSPEGRHSVSFRACHVSLREELVSRFRAEPSSSAVLLVALHGSRPRRRARENLPRRDESPRRCLLLNRKGGDLLSARPQRRGEDDPPADPRDPAEADRRPRVCPRSRRAPRPEGHPAPHRSRPPGSPAADDALAVRPHPLLLPDSRPLAKRGPLTDPQGHGGSGPLGTSRQARLGPVRRTPPAADHRDGPGRGPRRPIPRRAHDRARSARSAFRLAYVAGAHTEGRHHPLDHALPRRSGSARRPSAHRR